MRGHDSFQGARLRETMAGVMDGRTTATGRMGAHRPAIQNIPIPGIHDRRVRETFPVLDRVNPLDFKGVETRLQALLEFTRDFGRWPS